ncbi:P-loop containing nucleoside triphosphate hydrolase protein [Thelonectria olida]|uniref:ATP-dependent RNA helicase n=1 Tax=Thelonectria olida TaxID=1576542 RepID=A0A9P9AW84_9HYPO|nr:P-loop containing nucleoside triphosphate hydrolase protein [Thelonectria olida]
MFRNSLRRCTASARSAASASLISQTRTLPIASRRIASIPSSITPLNRIASIARAYSSEAPAAQEETSATARTTSPDETVKFTDLDGIHPNILRAITHELNYDEMTPVQAKTIQPALKGTDIVAQAKTGTGKTIAFLLPLLQRMINEDPSLANRGARRDAHSGDIRGIVLSPTRELAEQIAMEARRLVKNTGLVVQSAVGGTAKRQMLQRTRREGCHLLIATPGRLNDLLQDPTSGIDAPNLAALVLDEADRMLDVGFERELNEIIGLLPKQGEKVRQTVLVSATIPDTVIRLARTMVRANDFEFVQTIPENESLTHEKVPQRIVAVSSWSNVFPSLFELIDREHAKAAEDPSARPFKAIVYFNTTALVELAGEMGFERRRSRIEGRHLATYSIQSKLSQMQRQKAADMFRKGKEAVLFSSDVTARGMDFPDVTHVIQVDVPRDRESYIHRLGRTGRQGKEGEGWIIVPHSSISSARKMLKGLPLTQNNSLESADVDLASGGELTPAHQHTKNLFAVMPKQVLASTYTSMFGMVGGDKMNTVAEEVNDWAVHGWGWDAPPSVSRRWVSLMGLTRAKGMNISDVRRDARSHGRDRDNQGSRFDGQESGDAFDSMRNNIRRDDGGRGRDTRGGSGSRWGRNDRGGGNSGSRWDRDNRGGYGRRNGGEDGGLGSNMDNSFYVR